MVKKNPFPQGLTKANNTPVGSAGQPDKVNSKASAIERRMAKNKRQRDDGAKN